jgi:hypothetical protein
MPSSRCLCRQELHAFLLWLVGQMSLQYLWVVHKKTFCVGLFLRDMPDEDISRWWSIQHSTHPFFLWHMGAQYWSPFLFYSPERQREAAVAENSGASMRITCSSVSYFYLFWYIFLSPDTFWWLVFPWFMLTDWPDVDVHSSEALLLQVKFWLSVYFLLSTYSFSSLSWSFSKIKQHNAITTWFLTVSGCSHTHLSCCCVKLLVHLFLQSVSFCS